MRWPNNGANLSVPSNQTQGPQWLDELRLRASDQLTAHGLPHRKDEDWKYTPMRVLEKLNPAIAKQLRLWLLTLPLTRPMKLNFRLALLDTARLRGQGLRWGSRGSGRQGPAGCDRSSTQAEGLERYEPLLRKHIESVDISGSAQAFAALNTASLNQGLVIHIHEQTDAGTILLRWALSGKAGPSIHNFRVFLLLAEGARMQLMEQFESTDHGGSAMNVVSHVELGTNAVLDHLSFAKRVGKHGPDEFYPY